MGNVEMTRGFGSLTGMIPASNFIQPPWILVFRGNRKHPSFALRSEYGSWILKVWLGFSVSSQRNYRVAGSRSSRISCRNPSDCGSLWCFSFLRISWVWEFWWPTKSKMRREGSWANWDNGTHGFFCMSCVCLEPESVMSTPRKINIEPENVGLED